MSEQQVTRQLVNEPPPYQLAETLANVPKSEWASRFGRRHFDL